MKRLILVACAAFALASCSDDETPAPRVTGIELDRTEASLTVGETLQLTASVTPSEASDPVVWSSSDEAVATVTDEGLVTALTAGKATVKASCGAFSATCAVEVRYPVISFEPSEAMIGIDGKPAVLGTISVVSGKDVATFSQVYWAKVYTEANDLRDQYNQLFFAKPLFATADQTVWFSSYYCDCTLYGAQYDAWGGFILSGNANRKAQAGIANQFDVYADGGANGTEVFAVGYDAKSAGMAMSADCCWPQVDFTDGAHRAVSIALANSTWTYNHFTGSDADRFVVRITGKRGDTETGTVECTLIEGAAKVDGWKTFDLTSLGEVDCLAFQVVSSDRYAPFYFCADELTYIK